MLYEKWKQLKNKDDPESKAEMDDVEEEQTEKYFNKVKLASRIWTILKAATFQQKYGNRRRKYFPAVEIPPRL